MALDALQALLVFLQLHGFLAQGANEYLKQFLADSHKRTPVYHGGVGVLFRRLNGRLRLVNGHRRDSPKLSKLHRGSTADERRSRRQASCDPGTSRIVTDRNDGVVTRSP